MKSATKFGTFEELIAAIPADLQAICTSLKEVILDLHPETVEVVRLGDNAASYGLGPKKMSEAYAYIMPRNGYVNLGFFYGAILSDPDGLLEGTGKKLRHVKIRSLAQASDEATQTLLREAIAERRATLGR
ncbi:MAG: DUF1801 domain-containing protein [Bacteroidota bacterium]